jgi:hypothetical protein
VVLAEAVVTIFPLELSSPEELVASLNRDRAACHTQLFAGSSRFAAGCFNSLQGIESFNDFSEYSVLSIQEGRSDKGQEELASIRARP